MKKYSGRERNVITLLNIEVRSIQRKRSVFEAETSAETALQFTYTLFRFTGAGGMIEK